MSSNPLPMLIPKTAQQGIIQYHYQCNTLINAQWNLRENMRIIDLAYQREQNWTEDNVQAILANRRGDANKYQDITVPVVLPQVEASVSYQSSVFLQGYPIFELVAPPKSQDAAMSMNTIMAENATRGGWKREFNLAFRDAFKYNLAAVEVKWDRSVTASFETDMAFAGGLQGKPKETIWQGNAIKRLDLYNTSFDTRVCPADISKKGEFVQYTEIMGRVALKQFVNELPDKMIDNIKEAFASGLGTVLSGGSTSDGARSYFVPQINPNSLITLNSVATTNWMAWAGLNKKTGGAEINYQNLYEVTTLHARIIPSDFGLRVPQPNTPQVWRFIIINHQVVIYAERQTNAHGLLPVIFTQPLEDGLGYQTKGQGENAMPFQYATSALMNSMMAGRRRAATDRVIYDPSRITESHINSPNPSAKIPVRPSAYGKNISDSVYAFPFRDDQAAHAFNDISQILNLADVVGGHNKAQQGQFTKGNRTRAEYEDIMGSASSRDAMCSILLEDQFFTPIKHILKSNILQYQGGVTLFNKEAQAEVTIDPVKLREAIMEFKVADGQTPTSKLIAADTLQVAMQVIGSSPQIGGQYNIAPMFSYLMKTQGADLRDFEKTEEQVAYEQGVSAWQSAYGQTLEIIRTLSKAFTPENAPKLIEDIMGKLPPQPKPQDYGYNPSGETSNGNPQS